MTDRRLAAYLTEFLGTFLLVLFVTLVVVVNSPGGLGYTDFAVVGLVHVFVLALLISAFGAISGAHFNPAVTAALAAVRRIAAVDAIAHVFFQLAGGVAAALVTKLIVHDQGVAANLGAPSVSTTFLHGHTFTGSLVEAIGTFVLVLSIMAMAVNPAVPTRFAGLVIGGTLGMAVMVLGPLTGAGLNPARSFGPALVADAFNGGGKFVLVYVLGPLVGGVLAALGYKFLVLDDDTPVGP